MSVGIMENVVSCAVGNGGNAPNIEGLVYFYHPDHLGSSSYITDANGEVSQHLEYFAFGETFVEEHSNKDRTPYLYNAKELDEETGLYYYGARYYDPVTSVWQSVDPLVEETMTPYQYVNQNPIKFVDPTGMSAENPIYGTDGEFLGTDDRGLQGKAIVMNKENFMQGMSHEAAISKGTLSSDMPMVYKPEIFDEIDNHFESLANRPDYDGKLTLSEANEWYRGKSGKPLYVNASKIDISTVKKSDFSEVGDSFYKNFFFSKNTETGLVYGTIKLTLTNNEGDIKLGNPKTGYLDNYGFEQQKGRAFRNIATWIGKKYAGEGKSFDIYNYGTSKVE